MENITWKLYVFSRFNERQFNIILYLYLSLLLLLLNEELKIKRTNAMEIHTSVKINFELEGEPSQSWLAGGSQTLPPTIHEYIYRDISPIPHEHDYYYCVCLCFVAKQCGFFTVTAMGNHLNILFLYYKNYYYPWLYRPTSPPLSPSSLCTIFPTLELFPRSFHHFYYCYLRSMIGPVLCWSPLSIRKEAMLHAWHSLRTYALFIRLSVWKNRNETNHKLKTWHTHKEIIDNHFICLFTFF